MQPWLHVLLDPHSMWFLTILLTTTGLILHDKSPRHYDDVIMSTMASQTTSFMIVYPTIYSGADQRKHQSSASLAFVGGIHRWPVNYPHKGPVTRKMFSFEDVIMLELCLFRNLSAGLEGRSNLLVCNVRSRKVLHSTWPHGGTPRKYSHGSATPLVLRIPWVIVNIQTFNTARGSCNVV